MFPANAILSTVLEPIEQRGVVAGPMPLLAAQRCQQTLQSISRVAHGRASGQRRRTRSRARDSRDFTVPTGTPRVAATS
jgi:hypothetical protein